MSHAPKGKLSVLTLAALGVVFGDIGTSPLYSLRECFHGEHAIHPTPENVMGVLSLVLWAMIVVVSLKYVVFVMRADNHGEGGVLALTALVPQNYRSPAVQGTLVALGLVGASLLYGDGVITPAISVLGAVEGLSTVTPALTPYVVPITVVILLGLFWVQRSGTASVGAFFGPVMLAWFITLALLGLPWIFANPAVLGAFNPMHGVAFFGRNGLDGFLVLGSVFLVVTGGEALYADMGHFGRTPIRMAWFAVSQPALMLNYLGQAALLMARPEAADQPFYSLAPASLVLPLVGLATAAAVIASQALISAVFSLTGPVIRMGFGPRMHIEYTSEEAIGQVYLPAVNWAVMVGTLAMVVSFGSSSALAAAYGIAVTATMVITTILAYVVARQVWMWSRGMAGILAALLITVDLAFFGANLLKIAQGGWVPLAMAAALFVLMTTWKRGRQILGRRLHESSYPLDQLLAEIPQRAPYRAPGTAVYMTGARKLTPPALLHNLTLNNVLHERIILLTVVTADTPFVDTDARRELEVLGSGLYRVTLHFGFMERPDVPRTLARTLPIDPDRTTFVLGRETVRATKHPGMAKWREKLFVLMMRNAAPATRYFNLPTPRVLELGMQVDL